MFLWFRYHRDLWRTDMEAKRIRKRYAQAYRRLLCEERSSHALFAITANELEEMERLEHERYEALSLYLGGRATPLGIPVPDTHDGDFWETSHKTGMRRLNKKALATLQTAIRSEKKQRLHIWEQRTKIFSLAITALTGLIGALIGLMTLASHR